MAALRAGIRVVKDAVLVSEVAEATSRDGRAAR
jgi:hypothetical protein